MPPGRPNSNPITVPTAAGRFSFAIRPDYLGTDLWHDRCGCAALRHDRPLDERGSLAGIPRAVRHGIRAARSRIRGADDSRGTAGGVRARKHHGGLNMRLDCGLSIVREWREADRDSLLRFANNRKVWRNLKDRFPHPYTGKDADAWFKLNRANPGHMNWALEVDGQAVGGIGLVPMNDVYARTVSHRLLAWRALLGTRHHDGHGSRRIRSRARRRSASCGSKRRSSHGTPPRCACSKSAATHERPS